MKYSNNVINILTAQTYKGIGRAWIVKNIKGQTSKIQKKTIFIVNIVFKKKLMF